ncbi:MAG: hypothetical protein IJ716_12885 [Lachnospiraceae bacterium]|nr:hypothetical protein [Lachnospiraceae bacterium]
MNYTDIRRISLEFRRLSSNLLTSDRDNVDVNLDRFYEYINNNSFIADIIHKTIDSVDYDYKKCFIIRHAEWSSIEIPREEKCHIKAMYDFMTYIVTSENESVFNLALQFNCGSNSFNDMIRYLLEKSFKPLIDYINDKVSIEMMIMDGNRREESGNTFVQNIQNLHGNANQQGGGIITTYTTNNEHSAELMGLLEKIINSLDTFNEINKEMLDNVRDDLESIQEQIVSDNPKKNRLQKALNGIKSFVGQLPVNIVASTAANAITSADWASLIQYIEAFISFLH